MGILNTGERILLEKETPLMIARHFCAYKFAKDYIAGKSVLDIGCGEGYGTNYLAEFVKEAIGVDYDKAIIDYAKAKYTKNNLAFYQLDVAGLDSLNRKFDTVCSFQVIEHIQDTKIFLENIKNLLNDQGIFICSTPNKIDASGSSEMPLNKFHVKEYLYGEFRHLLEAHFNALDMFVLKRSNKLNFYRRIKKIGLFNFLPAKINPVERFYACIDCDNFIITKDGLDTALDFIAVCKNL